RWAHRRSRALHLRRGCAERRADVPRFSALRRRRERARRLGRARRQAGASHPPARGGRLRGGGEEDPRRAALILDTTGAPRHVVWVPLALLHPATRAWFAATFAAPTRVQVEGWPKIAAGHNAVLAAPTGSGKTLAAFLMAIDRLVREPPAARPGVRVLYVSPL